ncbi:MAG: hypothetical protein U0002_16640 [Thermoanaerobaculia bacterium]
MLAQLTIRGFEPELEAKIQEVARRERISLNKAVLKLLRRGAGLEAPEPKQDVIGNSLDWFIGSGTEEDLRVVQEAEEWFERIDEELWK